VLLVSGGDPAPVTTDDCEDWVRLPVSDAELRVRMATVAGRARRAAPPVVPRPDADGIVRTERGWVALPPLEARVVTLLAADAGRVVRRAALEEAGWPDGRPADPRALDGVVKRLRRRLAPLGLAIHTIAGRGFLLEAPPSG
jgi:DNA-binding response OmpR family regulator